MRGTLIGSAVAILSLSFGGELSFPENWRTMKEVEKGVILRGNPLYGIVPGFHRTYMNETAYRHFREHFAAFKKGSAPPQFPKGAEVVFVNFKDKEGKTPRVILVMKKTGDPKDEGGWKWEGFLMPAKKRIVKNPAKDCANCHYKGQKDWDGIFLPHAK